MNDAALIDILADILIEGGCTDSCSVAQAALAALRAHRVMLVWWERADEFLLDVSAPEFYGGMAIKEGRAYKLASLKPPAELSAAISASGEGEK